MTTPSVPPRRPARASALAAALLLAASLLGTPSAWSAPQPGGVAAVEPWFEWSMPDRYGVDGDRDGLIDMVNTTAYVHGAAAADCRPECPGASFPTSFEAHLGDGIAPGAFPMVRYEWTLLPENGDEQRFSRYAPQLLVSLPEGNTEVILRVVVDLPFRSFGIVARDTIEVEDILVVAIGDSYASGEGNPERRRGLTGDSPFWADGAGDREVEADHAAARRSSLAWPSQMALHLERTDPHTSVTFVSVAASSATVDKGLLGPQNERLPLAQVPRAAEMVGERDIDLLLVSIGGNDIGFSRLIAGLVDADAWLDPICYENDLDNIWASVVDGEWNRASRLSWRISDPFHIRCRTERIEGGANLAGLAGLESELDRLAVAVDGSLHPARVLLMEYPDPTGHSTGLTTELCDEIVGDAAPLGLHEINREEQRLGRSEVLDPLNGALRSAADRHGWSYVEGVVDAFTDGHGYCAPWPDYADSAPSDDAILRLEGLLEDPDAWFRSPGLGAIAPMPGPFSWYRTAGQSVVLQGPDSRIDTTGTMHPNELGHRALADLALALLETG